MGSINELLNCVLCNWVPSRDEKTQPEFGPPLLTYVLPSGSILLDHFIRPKQNGRRNRDANLLRRLEIDEQLKLLRLLHW